MNNTYKRFNNILNKNILSERYENCLKEQDFYPPEDNRVLESYVQDIYGGDSFCDYCRYIFNVLDEEEYYD